ncbi:LysR family transcriptional regulator [Agrobacterium tumefaciens]
MRNVDLNLLLALDALLAEGSVTGAARRLGLSASAMSRTLTRLRTVTGDPLLVRAGRGLVPTPRAADLRDRVHGLTRDVQDVLTPQGGEIDVTTLARTFTIRANEGFIEQFAATLVVSIIENAPNVRLCFAAKPEKDATPLREGAIDLEIGVLGVSAPEVRTQLLFRDEFVGVARAGHSLFDRPVTPERYAGCRHVVASRRGAFTGPVDDALEALGLSRVTAVVVPGFPDALRIARQSDLVALVPRTCLHGDAMDAGTLGKQLVCFDLPIPTPKIAISAMWHPRMDVDPAHRWLRDMVMAVCRQIWPL